MQNYVFEEYKMLRSEILYMIKMIKICEGFAVATIGSSISLIFQWSNGLLLIFLMVFLYMLNAKIYEYYLGIAKLSSYMHVFLEPKLEGIKWETNNILYNEKEELDIFGKINYSAKFDNFLSKYIISFSVIIISILSTFHTFKYSEFHNSVKICIVMCAVCFGIMAAVSVVNRSKSIFPRKEYITKWHILKNDISN